MASDYSGFLGPALVPAVVIAVIALLRRCLPSRKQGEPARPLTSREADEFRKLQWLVNAAMVAVGIGFAFVTYQALLLANQHLAEADGPARFQLLPTKVIWCFFPGFGALCLAWDITLLLWSTFGDRRKVLRFIQWTNENAGYNSTRALRDVHN